jgi:hypothetical protein
MRSEPGRRIAVPALCALAILAAVPGQSAEVVERVLADVDGRPVLLSEVRLLETLRGLDRGAALEAAVEARLMYREAARVPQAAVSDVEAERACKSLAERAGQPAPEPPRSELCALARREAAIVKYIDFRFAPQVSGDGQDAGAAGEALNLRIEEWVKELRAAAQVRYGP